MRTTWLKRAALQCLTNLVPCEIAMERLRSPELGPQDILLFLVFAQVEDVASQSAATGALAMMSDDPDIAQNIVNCKLNQKQPTEEEDDDKYSDEKVSQDLDAELAAELAKPAEADLQADVQRSDSTYGRAKARARARAKAKLGKNKGDKQRTGLSVLKEILADKTTHRDVRARVEYTMANLKKHGALP